MQELRDQLAVEREELQHQRDMNKELQKEKETVESTMHNQVESLQCQ